MTFNVILNRLEGLRSSTLSVRSLRKLKICSFACVFAPIAISKEVNLLKPCRLVMEDAVRIKVEMTAGGSHVFELFEEKYEKVRQLLDATTSTSFQKHFPHTLYKQFLNVSETKGIDIETIA